MSFTPKKSIDELYQQVKDKEYVLTREAPLADALNNRIDRPRVGKLAYTPRGLVYEKDTADESEDRRELFLNVIRETDLSWKKVLYCIENILDCWQETGRSSAILEYPAFLVEGMEDVLEIVERSPSVYRKMKNYRWDNDVAEEIAVIGKYQFKQLDAEVLPDVYQRVEFDHPEGSVDLPPFTIFPSSNRLVRTLANQINHENASSIALVINPTSPYQHMVSSILQAREIPVMGGQTLTETQAFRSFYGLLRCSVGSSRLRLEDIQPLLTETAVRGPIRENEKYLESVSEEKMESFRQLIRNIPGMSFQTVLDEFVDRLENPDQHQNVFQQLEKVLRSNGLIKKTVTPGHLGNLHLYLNHFDVPIDSKNKCGVLVANPNSEAIVDREIVFYLGMDADWTRNIPDKPWIDRRQHRNRNLKDFQVLLQNGQKRYFLVQEERANESVTPCFYFHVLFDDEFEQFSDRENHERIAGQSIDDFVAGKTFETEPTDVEIEPYQTISQSTLNTFVRSPREWMVNRLVTTPENEYMTRGNLFHEYAEAYANDPEQSEQMEEEIRDWMVERMLEFVDGWRRPELETEFRIGVENIRRFVDNQSSGRDEIDGYSHTGDQNQLAEQFGIEIDSPRTEAWFENPALGAHGKVDWIPRTNTLVDYKSGSRDTVGSMVKNSNLELLRDEKDPNFQAMLYLAHQRTVVPDRPLHFVFYYFLEDLDDRVLGNPSNAKTISRVTYYPRPFSEQILTDEAIDYFCETKKYRKLFEKLPRERYRVFFKNHELPDFHNKHKLLRTDFAKEWKSFVNEEAGEAKKATGLLKKIVRYRITHYFKEDLDRFDQFLKEQRNQLNTYREYTFPLYGYQGEIDLSRLNRRDLILPVE